MIKNAKKSVTIMTTSQGLSRKAEAFRHALTKAKERGVVIRIITPSSKETEEAVRMLKGVAEVKHSASLKSRFCITDDKEVTFMLLDDNAVHPTYDTGVWVTSEFFSKAMSNFFNSEWKNL